MKYTNDDMKEKNALSAAFDEINASVQSINESKKQVIFFLSLFLLYQEKNLFLTLLLGGILTSNADSPKRN